MSQLESNLSSGLPSRGKPSPHSTRNRVGRVLWSMVQATAFRFSPRPMHRSRNLLLRLFGAQIHPTARVYPRARIWGPWNLSMGAFSTIGDDVDVYCVDRIAIGERTTVSQYTYLCGATHDFEDIRFPLTPKPITIGSHVWLAADCFVAPGVTIPDGAVIGARSGVFGTCLPWMVHAGTPAKPLRNRHHPLSVPTESGTAPDAHSAGDPT